MAGISATTTTILGNVDGAQAHFAVSTETIVNTATADSTLLAANGGSYREGDIVIVTCSDGLLVGKVSGAGAIVA